MKGQDFYNNIKHLFEQQWQQESSIDFKKVLETAGGQDEITPSHRGNELSEFFVDPTLFSLLREYNESTDDKPSHRPASPSQQQQQQDDPTSSTANTNKKPQARDVLSKRVLDEQDSNDDHVMDNPTAPRDGRHEAKYRAVATNTTNNDTNTNASMDDTHSYPCGRYRAIALQPSTSITNIDTNNSSSNNNNNNNSNEAFEQNHPDIPATSISKKFMDMATLLEHSPLRTIKKSHLMDIPPRIKQRLNYAHSSDPTTNPNKGRSNKRKGKAVATNQQQKMPNTTTTTPSASSSSSSSGHVLPILHPMKQAQHHDGELIFTISIYQAHAPSKKLQEFHVLGSQTLTEVRDALYCRMDFSAHGDRKDQQPDGEIINTFRQKRSPSYFYIDKTFYVDQRLPMMEEEDESKGVSFIRRWLQHHLNQSTVMVPMDALALRDLPLQLNTPYLFDHQQHCQHLVMIRDIRLLESRDKRYAEHYPIVTYSWRYRRYKCNMCMIYPAVYVTTNDYLSGFSPCFFCERCYEPFHFDKFGNAVTTFDVCAYHGT